MGSDEDEDEDEDDSEEEEDTPVKVFFLQTISLQLEIANILMNLLNQK